MSTDPSAAKMIASRRGAGRVRLVEVRELWIQGRVARGELTIVKVKGKHNVAGGLTKHVEMHETDEHVKVCEVARRSGRHKCCPYLGDV